MATSRGNSFDPKLVSDLINKVKGKSSLAALAPQIPIPFNGIKEFIFSLDKEIDIVAENGKKSHGGLTLEPIKIVPIKFEYGARVSDEFLYATEEEQIAILENFNEGFAKKAARGLDIAAMHGLNPRTGTESSVVGDNCFDKKVTQTVVYNSAKPDASLESAIALVEGSDGDVSGMAISKTVRSDLAAMSKSTGEKLYPEFAFGGQPSNLGTNALSINGTVSVGSVDEAIVGGFADYFKWGYSKDVTFKVIEYGDPDNSGADLQGAGQVYLRCELYLGWGIFVPESFARVTKS